MITPKKTKGKRTMLLIYEWLLPLKMAPPGLAVQMLFNIKHYDLDEHDKIVLDSDIARELWEIMLPDIQKHKQSYMNIVERNSKHGKLSAQARQTEKAERDATQREQPVNDTLPEAAAQTQLFETGPEEKAPKYLSRIEHPDDKRLLTGPQLKEYIRKWKPKQIEPYVDAWNFFAGTRPEAKLPIIKDITPERRKHFAARNRQKTFSFLDVLERLKVSFLLDGSRTWLTFDWLITNGTNFVKVLEGNYDARKQPEVTPASGGTKIEFKTESRAEQRRQKQQQEGTTQ